IDADRAGACRSEGDDGHIAVRAVDDNALAAARIPDDAGLADHPRNVGHSADHLFPRHVASDKLDAVDAVLERDHAGAGHDEWRQRCGGSVRIPQFNGEKHEIYRTDLGGDVGRGYLRQVEIAERTLDPETAPAQRSEMRTSCNKSNVLTRGDEAGTD